MPRTRRKLTDEQRRRFQEARTFAAELHESLERLAELLMCCECEANPNCPVCRVFGIAAPLEHKMDTLRVTIDRELERP